MAKCESCGREIGTKRVCPHCSTKQLKYAGTTEGPDMFFWMKGLFKPIVWIFKLIFKPIVWIFKLFF